MTTTHDLKAAAPRKSSTLTPDMTVEAFRQLTAITYRECLMSDDLAEHEDFALPVL